MVLKTSGSITGEEICSLTEGLKKYQGLCCIKTPHMCINLENSSLKHEWNVNLAKWFSAKLLRRMQICHR